MDENTSSQSNDKIIKKNKKPQTPKPPEEPIISFGALNTAEIIDTAFEVLKRTFFQQIGYRFIMGIFGVILFFVLEIMFILLAVGTGFLSSFLTLSTPIFVVISLIVSFIVFFILLVFYSISNVGSVILTKQILTTNTCDFTKVFKTTFISMPRFCSVLFAQLLLLFPLVVVLCLIYFVGVWYSIGFINFSSFSSAFALSLDRVFYSVIFIVATFLYYLFAIIVILMANTLFTTNFSVCIHEKKSFFSALKRSLALIKGDYWKIFGVTMLLNLIIVTLIYSLIFFSTLIVSLFSLIFSSSIDYQIISTISVFVMYIILIFVTPTIAPLYGILLETIYVNQRIKKEGYDISMKIELFSYQKNELKKRNEILEKMKLRREKMAKIQNEKNIVIKQ